MDAVDLAARVEALEASNRRLRAWGGILTVSLAAVTALGQAAPPAKAIEGESVTLRDKDGGKRIHLGPGDGDSWAATVFDAQGKPRAAIRVGGKGIPQVEVQDATGGRRAELSAIGDAAGLYLRADGGKLRAYFTTHKDLPIWDLFDASGNSRCGASIAKEGSAGISLFGKDGATRAGLINNPDDSTRLTLRTGPNDMEKRVCQIQTFPQGAAQFEISDPKEKARLVFGYMPDGTCGFNIVDGANKPRVSLAALPGTSVLQLFGAPGNKGAELHAVDPATLPREARGKTPPASLILFDAAGKEAERLPADR
jgi:hypothetical protein